MYNDGIREDASERDVNKRISQIFFKNEKMIREKNEITQKAMGELLGCTSMTISNWELGKRIPENLDEIIKIVADLFDLDPGVLVAEDFADRYEPNAYPEVKIEEVIAGPSDRDITLRYLKEQYDLEIERRTELEEQLEKINMLIEGYRLALEVLNSSN